jgi:hypothetical protein
MYHCHNREVCTDTYPADRQEAGPAGQLLLLPPLLLLPLLLLLLPPQQLLLLLAVAHPPALHTMWQMLP